MSFLDRSVPLKYVILSAIAAAVFTGTLVHGLQSRSDSIEHYGPALPAKVIKVDDPKTVGTIFGLWGSTYTNAEVKVMLPSGKPWYYWNVPLDGRLAIGHELKAWFYDGNPDSAYFSDSFDTSSNEAVVAPWPSLEHEWTVAFFLTLIAMFGAFIILKALSPKKSKKRNWPASSRRKTTAT